MHAFLSCTPHLGPNHCLHTITPSVSGSQMLPLVGSVINSTLLHRRLLTANPLRCGAATMLLAPPNQHHMSVMMATCGCCWCVYVCEKLRNDLVY